MVRLLQITGMLFVYFFFSCSNTSNKSKNEEKRNRSIDTSIITNYAYQSILPINEPRLYYHIDDSMKYELSLNRINEIELIWTLKISKNHQLFYIRNDTVFLDKLKGGRLSLKYGYGIPGIKFSKKNHGICSTTILIDNKAADFVRFIHKDFGKRSCSTPKVLLLEKIGANEPYKAYIKSLIKNISYDYFDNRRNISIRRKEKIEKQEIELSKLLKQIKEHKKEEEIIKDTSLLDLANYYSMNKVAKMLLDFGFSNRKRVPWTQIQGIPLKNFSKFIGTVEIDRDSNVISNRFERMYFNFEPNPKFSIPGFKEFSFFNDSSIFLKYQDKLVTTMHDFGFEGVSHIITVWDRIGDTIFLETILDKLLVESLGSVRLDTVFRYDSTKNIMIGNSSGSDEGEIWGSLWIGIWEKPRDFKVVYKKRWSAPSEEYRSIDYKILSNNIISIIEKTVWFENIDGKYKQKTRTLSRKRLKLNSLVRDKKFVTQISKENYE